MKLRPYQNECHADVKAAYKQGITRQLIVQATGLGKAVQAATIPDVIDLRSDRRMMVLVHRDELAYQMAEKLTRCNPGLSVGIEKATSRAYSSDVVVASVQTIGKVKNDTVDGENIWEYSPRLKRFNPEHFDVVQVDECHHLSVKAIQWSAILRYMRVLKKSENEDRNKLLIGWTATPDRADNLGLEQFFDKIVFNYGIKEAIDDKWLSTIVAYRAETEVDISKIKTTMGDLNVGDLSRTVNTPERNELVARKYKEHTPGLPAMFFTVDIQHSHDISEVMGKHGWRVYPISGNTPDGERRRLLRLMRDGDIHGLASCGVLSEGTDIPNAEAAYMLRPTKSGLLYRQQVGRVLRLSPSPEDMEEMRRQGIVPKRIKPHAVVVDFCDVSGRHSLITIPTLFGLRQDFDSKGKKIVEIVDEIEEMEEKNPGLDLKRELNMDAIRASLRNIDLLRAPMTPPEVTKNSRFPWISDGRGQYKIGLLDGSILSIRENQLGHFEIHSHNRGIKSFVAMVRTIKDALEAADSKIPYADQQVINASAKWRNDPPSEKQISLLYYLDKTAKKNFNTKVDFIAFCTHQFSKGDHNFTKGAISRRIDSLTAAR